MIIGGRARRAPGPVPRLARLFLGRNELRRRCDRIEGAILVSLSAAFVTATVVAVSLAWHICQSQHAAAARLRPTVAVVSAPGLVIADVYVLEAPQPPPPSQYDIVLNGALKDAGMVSFKSVLERDDVTAIRNYVIHRANEDSKAQKR